jgi:hypothetical protein
VLDPTEVVSMDKAEAEKGAEKAFRAVLEHGPKIELDHHLVYYTRECRGLNGAALTDFAFEIVDYELGRLLANQGKVDAAKKDFELVLSGMLVPVLMLDVAYTHYFVGKYLEVGPSGRKVRFFVDLWCHCLVTTLAFIGQI